MMKLLRWWRYSIRKLNRKKPYLGLLVHFLATAILAFLIFAISNAFLLSTTIVDGRSMEPTLHRGDRLLIFKSERLVNRLLGSEYVPERGDIIVLNKKDLETDFASHATPMLIKRVIGLPEERVIIQNNKITIYNQEYPQGFEPDLGLDLSFKPDELRDVEVKRGEVFVLGDNHQASVDSRKFGNISVDDIVGKLVLRIWPVSEIKTF